MAIEKVRAYLETFGAADRVREALERLGLLYR